MKKTSDIFDVIANGDSGQLQQLFRSNRTVALSRNENGVSAMMTALYYGKADMFQLLRNQITEFDLFEAAALGDEQQVINNLKNLRPEEIHSADGFTALHLAAFFNQKPSASLLVDAGADVNAVADNPSQVQPLHSAVAGGSVEIIKLLLQRGANVDARQKGGWTALQAAAKVGETCMLDILLDFGANPEQTADDGATAITLAKDETIRTRLEKHEFLKHKQK